MTGTPSLSFLKDKISKVVKPGATIILGLSGGPDSVFLLHQLATIKPRPNIIAGHVNYNLRGKDSEKDREFVQKLCAQMDVPLELLEIHGIKKQLAKRNGNLEEYCREVRYQFLEKLRREHNASIILIAHHLNDQLETFFLNLTRGSSLSGFRAMREYDEDRKLFRPLLDLPKTEIISWLQKNSFKYRLDKTNFSENFSRNLIRAKVIPSLEKINPRFLKTAGASLKDLDGNLQVVETVAAQWITKNLKNNRFSLEHFLANPEIMKKNILRRLYRDLHGQSLTTHTLREIIGTLDKNQAGLRKEFGKNTHLKIVKDNKNSKRLVEIIAKFQ